MFIKTLKHDFTFSKVVFLGMAGIIIALAVFLRLYNTPQTAPVYSIAHTSSASMEWLFIIVMMFVAMVSIFQVMAFFRNSFFYNSGYLILTLPVTRFMLLASKLVVAVAWFNFMLFAAAIAVVILDSPQTSFQFLGLTRGISLQNIVALVDVNFVAMSLMLGMFFVITFANCRLFGWRVHGFVAATIGLLYCWFLFWVHTVIRQRHLEWVTTSIPDARPVPHFDLMGEYIGTHYSFQGFSVTQSSILGTDIGRIPIGDGGAYLDVYSFGVSVILCVLAFWATHYLLARRVSV